MVAGKLSQYPNVQCMDEQTKEYDSVRYLPPTGRRVYTDLRDRADDKTILANPHKGWFWHYIDNGLLRPAYRAEHDPTDHLEDFPGLNHLYLRFDWGDIEKEEGTLDWSAIDAIMDEWGRFGYRFSLRICAYEGNADIPFATPEYVFKAGARGYAFPDGRVEPDYTDPIFLEKLEAFMARAGQKFNGDKRIELIDIGTFGTWGEGHTGRGSERLYPAQAIKTHIDLHARYFPNIPILLNDDHINAGWERVTEENASLLDYARARGLGLQDDSVCVEMYFEPYGYNTLRTPWMFDMFWRHAPIVLEFEHYKSVPEHIFKGGFPFLDAIMRTHATFAGFHGYPRPWLQREPYLTEYCANRLGYWYFVNGVEVSSLRCGVPNIISLWMENRGIGLCYRDYELRLALIGTSGRRHTQSFNARNSTWQPGEETLVPLRLMPGELPSGDYGLYLGLFEDGAPIQLGYKSNHAVDGMVHLCNLPVLA